MPKKKLRLTEAEEQFVIANRYQTQLDNTDWSKEPIVSDKQLREMSDHVAARLRPMLTGPGWRYDYQYWGFRNINHPDNAEWVGKQMALDILAKEDSKQDDRLRKTEEDKS